MPELAHVQGPRRTTSIEKLDVGVDPTCWNVQRQAPVNLRDPLLCFINASAGPSADDVIKGGTSGLGSGPQLLHVPVCALYQMKAHGLQGRRLCDDWAPPTSEGCPPATGECLVSPRRQRPEGAGRRYSTFFKDKCAPAGPGGHRRRHPANMAGQLGVPAALLQEDFRLLDPIPIAPRRLSV